MIMMTISFEHIAIKKNGYDNDDSSGNITTNNNTNHFM